jgi:hypothetical protein
LSIQGYSSLVWSFSSSAPKKTTARTRIEIGHLIHTKRKPFDSLFTPSKSRLYQDFTDGDNFDEDSEYFDDFADFGFVVGDDAGAPNSEGRLDVESSELDSMSPMSVLQERFQKLALTEQMNRQQISENWKEGYWGVWGCSLDPYTEDDEQEKIFVTCIRQMQSAPENDGDDLSLLIVGRSDGSICWLQMETMSELSSSLSPSTSPSDNDPTKNVESRSITTYFENKLVAKATNDGGMIVDTALQRREASSDNDFGKDDGTNDDGSVNGSSPRLPFDMLAQIQTTPTTPTGSDASAAIVDMLPLPSARMVWTIAHGSPNMIQGWKVVPQFDSDILLPSMSPQSSKLEIERIHSSPIVGMKAIPKTEDDESDDSFVVSVSDNGQVVVWEIASADVESQPSIRILLDANLLQESQEEEHVGNDSILSIDVDDQNLYLGSQMGKIYIFSVSTITSKTAESAYPLRSLPLLKSFLAFTSNNPGVSTLLAAGPGTLGVNKNDSNTASIYSNRPPTTSLIAGDMSGGLKQWELIPAGEGRLEYWPRMASQKLPGGKPHVYETRESVLQDTEEYQNSPAIKKLMCIQQVLLAATDHDLTVWDSSTGKALYDMQGLDFTISAGSDGKDGSALRYRPSLVAAKDSVLVTNGMENFVCVHDFTMDRITSENAQDFLERDDHGGDDGDIGNGGNDSQNSW